MQFRDLFESIDGGETEGDGMVTRDELLAYYDGLNEDGSLTPLDIDAQVDDFLKKYDGNRDGTIRKWEMWGRYNWRTHWAAAKQR